VFVGGEKILDLPPLPEMKLVGAGPNVKRAGPNDLYIAPLGTFLERLNPPHPSAVLYADGETPFRLLIELMFMLSRYAVDRFILATQRVPANNVDQTLGFQVLAPSRDETGSYLLLLVNFGVAVKFLGQNVAEGCRSMAAGVAVPKQAGAYDFAALTTCINVLKPAAVQATQTQHVNPYAAYLTANPGTPYKDIVGTLHALSQAGIDSVRFVVSQ